MTHLPNWIQALAAAALVFLTWRTLLVLRGYAQDTKKIADKSVEQIAKSAEQINVSVQQTENAQRPFLALVSNPNTGEWGIANQGAGPALNIKHSNHHGKEGMVGIPPLAKGDFYILNSYNRSAVESRGFTINYESLGGVTYATAVTWVNGEMRTDICTALRLAPLPGESRI